MLSLHVVSYLYFTTSEQAILEAAYDSKGVCLQNALCMQPDVIIIGAGAAELAAADALSAAGRTVLILEVRDRLGGRICTIRDAALNVPIELGAEFIHGTPAAMWDLLRRAKLTAYDVPFECLITLPVGVLQQPSGSPSAVQFTPDLAAKRTAAKLGSGPVVKAVLKFREAFWQRMAPRQSRKSSGDLADAAFLHNPGPPFQRGGPPGRCGCRFSLPGPAGQKPRLFPDVRARQWSMRLWNRWPDCSNCAAPNWRSCWTRRIQATGSRITSRAAHTAM
jgi:Flavin containing amine oxidoreductase